ncbi:DNA polymerase III subunit delta [Tumebacillus sp. ITR2]|uniref:DNA polymerase III subunit delta n=1 Tax=Tumebacillus amylolyticus TaxID=2801339 RepID=A0ABS1JDV9_9BACL|nr:DNA polymerase III subunit delta [Tumebacillus amylolyticus]MBL0388395.1 DNA polymerase III subunit delta [Tumebacillus amylolyticus]
MPRSIRDIQTELKKGIIQPVYLLYGTEALLIDDVVQSIQDAALPQGIDDFNYMRFHYDESPIQHAVHEAETIPFLSERKLILVQNCAAFTSAKSPRVDHDPEALQAYMENPAPYTTLILTVFAEKLDERKKLTKIAQQKAAVVQFVSLKENECRDWIAGEVKRQGSSITNDGIGRLILSVGTNLRLLRSELEKLALYAGPGGTIDEAAVDMLATRTMEQNVFVFIDEVVRLRIDRAMRMMYDLLKNKEEPIKLLFMIARQVRMMLQVKLQSGRGYNINQIAQQLGVHPYPAKIAGEQGNFYSVKELEKLLFELGEIDYKIKTGQLGDRTALEMFILSLPHKVSAASRQRA